MAAGLARLPRLPNLTAKKHVLGMILITAIQAACFTLIKAGLDFAPPLLFGGMRALIGGSALLTLVAIRRGPLVLPRSTWVSVLLLSVVATTITFGAMFLSPGRTEAGIASALGNLQPFFTLLLAFWLFSEPLSAYKAAAVILGLAGVTLISYPALSDSSALGLSGAVFAMAVSLGASTANVMVKRMRLGDLLLTVTGWQLAIGGFFLILLSGLANEGMTFTTSIEFVGLLLFLALAGTALVIALWFAFVQEGEMGRLATFFYLVPVFGLAIAVVVFGEPVTGFTLGGVLVILLAVGLMAFERPPARA